MQLETVLMHAPTLTERAAHVRRTAFRAAIAAKAAELAAAKMPPPPVAPVSIETAAPIGPEVLEVLRRPRKEPWFYIVSVSGARKPSLHQIMEAVCDHFSLAINDMTTARRTVALARPRQVAMYLCKVLTDKSLPVIGRKFGGRDHTTVLHAVRKIESFCNQDLEFAAVVAKIRAELEPSQ